MMLKWRFALICKVLIVSLWIGSFGSMATVLADDGQTYVPGKPASTPAQYNAMIQRAAQQGMLRLIVSFNSAYGQRAAIQAAQGNLSRALAVTNSRVLVRFSHTPGMAVEVDAAGMQVLANDPSIVSIKEDIPGRVSDAASNAVVGAAAAWGQGYDGAGYVLAILDTGVDRTHSFLAGKVIAEACFSSGGGTSQSLCPNGGTTGANGEPGMTGVGAGADCAMSISGCGHGTHVAGIAAGKNYAGGPNFDGVAKNANIIAVQVFTRQNSTASCGGSAPCATYFTSDVIAALDYVYNTLSNPASASYVPNIAALNMSLVDFGGQYSTPCTLDPRANVVSVLRNNRNIATVISAGNTGNPNGISAPACIPTAISVGATNNSDAIASFSNRASYLSLYAPGVSVQSSLPGNLYQFYNGTSMAAPHVAGAWAVMRQKLPTGSVTQILRILRQKGPLIMNSSPNFSVPRLQLDKALADFGNKDTIGIYRPTNNVFYLRNSNTTGQADITAVLSGLGMNPNPPFNDKPVYGDWNGDGIDTVGFYRSSSGEYVLTNSTTSPEVDYYFVLGSPGDTPIVGDWNGDGSDGVGIFRPSNGLIYLKSQLTTGFADYTMVLGVPGDVGIAGDWNNDGIDSPGVYRPSATNPIFFLSNAVCNCSVFADYSVGLGIPGDQPFTGDWNGDGQTGLAVFRPSNGLTYLRNDSTSTGFADLNFVYGIPNDVAAGGAWQIPGVGGGASLLPEIAPTFVP